MKELETLDERIYQEVKRQCFCGTDYYQLLDRVGQLPVRHRGQRTRFDNLLEQGFGVYEIEDLQQLTDRYEVMFNHYAIHTTPEKLLSLLAQNNLVFGLSATADLPRHVRNSRTLGAVSARRMFGPFDRSQRTTLSACVAGVCGILQ